MQINFLKEQLDVAIFKIKVLKEAELGKSENKCNEEIQYLRTLE